MTWFASCLTVMCAAAPNDSMITAILTYMPSLESQCPIVDSVLGMLRMVANTAPRYEGILQLLHGGPIVYGTTTGVILSPFSFLADFDRISTNVAILIRATRQSCTSGCNLPSLLLVPSNVVRRLSMHGQLNCIVIVTGGDITDGSCLCC